METSSHIYEEQYNQAWALNRSNPQEAILLSEKLLASSLENSDIRGQALAYKVLGAANIWISKNEEALKYSRMAIDIFHSLNDKKKIADVYYHLGSNYSYMSDFDNAVKSYYKCYELNKELNDELGMADGLNGIGTVYYRTGENHKALEVLHQSKQLCEKHGNKDIYIKVLDGLGEAYFNLKEYEKALTHYEKSARISQEIGNKQVESFALDGLARTHGELCNSQKAEQFFQQSITIRTEIGFRLGQCLSHLHYAAFLRKNQRYNDAFQHVQNALALAEQINFKEIIFQSHEELANLFESKQEFSQALLHYKIYIQEKEKVIRERTDKIVRSMEIRQNLLKTETDKKILEARTKELEQFLDNLILMEEIGRKITSSLSVEVIVKTLYEEVNKLMCADGFGIGVYEKNIHSIVFPYYIEGDESFTNVVYPLSEQRPAVLCFSQKKEIIINDASQEISQIIPVPSSPKVGKKVESFLYIPLLLNNKPLGVITVQSFHKNKYNDVHVNILKNIASYTAIALENSLLYNQMEQLVEERTQELKKSKEEIEKNLHYQRLISEIGKKISSSLHIGDIFQELHAAVSSIMPAECFGIRLLDKKRNAVVYRFEIENGKRDAENMEVPLSDSNNYTVWCVKNKKEIFINDNLKEYSRYVKEIRVVYGDMPHSLLFVPMLAGEKVIGAVTVQSFSKNAYTSEHMNILRSLASFAAIALDNAHLYSNLENLVSERTQEVNNQKNIIEQKNKDILDSIRYARRIQQAVCIDPEGFKKIFPDSFIYYRPKDIVSGDFYWFRSSHEWILFAVADCTGHGVPGAFMSLICSELLNRISMQKDIQKTSDALEVIDRELRNTMFKSQEHSANDGMDIALCALNKESMKLFFSGAHRPLLHISNGMLQEFKGTLRSVGGNQNLTYQKFQMHQIDIRKNDIVILTSDGYADQFGGDNGKKLKFRNFKNIILKNHHRPMNLLGKLLDVEFDLWKGELDQVDDVCVMGIRF